MIRTVRSNEIHQYVGWQVSNGDNQWTEIVAVRPSRYQGIDIVLLDGRQLQSCFPNGQFEVRETIFGMDADWVRANVGLN